MKEAARPGAVLCGPGLGGDGREWLILSSRARHFDSIVAGLYCTVPRRGVRVLCSTESDLWIAT